MHLPFQDILCLFFILCVEFISEFMLFYRDNIIFMFQGVRKLYFLSLFCYLF